MAAQECTTGAAVPARARGLKRLRLINPASPLSTVTMPELIRKMTFTKKAIWAPLSLTALAAVVPDDWQVEIIDEAVTGTAHRARGDVDVVGITAMTAQAPRAYDIADSYRKLGVTVIMGGIHPSAMPQEALQHADAVCIGDGEPCLPKMLRDWQEGKLQKIYDWRNEPPAPIATPRKDLLDPRDYLIFNPIQTTRGCPHNCRFCTTPAIFGRKYRFRKIEDIIDEIAEAKERFGTRTFIFADDNFAGNHAWALELCSALERLGIRWASQCDILISKNDRLLHAMKRSGCIGLILGLESPYGETLKEAGKRFASAADYRQQIRKIQSFGINIWGAFIFGFDHDDWRRCMGAVRFAEQAGLAMACFPILTPYPGTKIWNDLLRAGRILTTDWKLYNGANVVFEPKNFTPETLRYAQLAAFAEFYSPASIFRRLKLWPAKPRSWAANLAIWHGIRYYYRRQGRPVPRWKHLAEMQRNFVSPAGPTDKPTAPGTLDRGTDK